MTLFLPIRLLFFLLLSASLSSCSTQPKLLAAQPAQVYTRTLYLPGYDRPVPVRYHLEHGLAVTEGDIILGSEAQLAQLEPQANVAQSRASRWPGGIIPYRIDASVSAVGEANINEAVKRWELGSAFRFVVRTTQQSYVTFTRGGAAAACFSAVGRRGGEQFVYLTATGSCSARTLVHELGHTIGLWHEQSRNDRDAWLKINYENITDGQTYNFDKTGAVGTPEGEYDYCSVMHYGAYAFSKNARPTLQFLSPPHCEQEVGRAEYPSRDDVKSANNLLGPQADGPGLDYATLARFLALYAAHHMQFGRSVGR